MANNKIEGITTLRLLDGVLQYSNYQNNSWKPATNAVEGVTSGFYLQLSDVGKYIRVDSASDVNVVIGNLPFEIGSTVTFEQAGTGKITITSNNVTLNGDPVTAGQYKVIQIICVASKEWTIIGGTAA